MKRVVAFCLAMMALVGTSSALEARKTVLVIQSYHPGLAWVGQCEKGIKEILGASYSLDFVYLDTKRLPAEDFQKKADEAWNTYQLLQPDLVMIGDDNGLRLLGPKFAETNTPVVFFGINNNPRSYFKQLPENMTGLLERVPLFPWIRHIQMILPSARKALVLFDQSPTTESILQVTFGARHVVDVSGIETSYISLGNWQDWQELINNLDGYDFIVMPTFHALKDTGGEPVETDQVIQWTSEHSPVPVFSHQDYTVGPKGTVGAYVVFGEAHGRLAGEMARDILGGKNVASAMHIIMDKEGQFYFNKQQLERFQLVVPEMMARESIFR